MSDLNEQLRAEFEAIAEKYDINVTLSPAKFRKDEPYKYVHTNHLFAIFCEGARRAPAAAPAPVAASEKEVRHALHIVDQARLLGWDENGDEGAWEFVTRSAYETGWNDRGPAPATAPIVQPVADELRAEIEKLTKWKLCMSYNDSYFGEPAGLVKRVAMQLDRLLDRAPAAAAPAPFAPPALAWAIESAPDEGETIISTVTRNEKEADFFASTAPEGWARRKIELCDRAAFPAAPAPVAASIDERGRFEAWVTRDMGPLGSKRSIERHPFESEEYSDRIMQGRWEDWQEAARAALAAAPAAAPIVQPVAWIATDLDGRADVGVTKEAAKRRAGESCTEFIALYDVPTPASSTSAAKDAALDIAVKALESIDSWRFGWDGDCGVQRVSSEALEKIAEARAAIASSAGEVKP